MSVQDFMQIFKFIIAPTIAVEMEYVWIQCKIYVSVLNCMLKVLGLHGLAAMQFSQK